MTTTPERALECRAALSTLSGEELGRLPVLALLREALDDYVAACADLSVPGWTSSRHLAYCPPRRPPSVVDLDAIPDGEPAIGLTPPNIVRFDGRPVFVPYKGRCKVPEGVLNLYEAVRLQPAKQLEALQVIERATAELRTLAESP